MKNLTLTLAFIVIILLVWIFFKPVLNSEKEIKLEAQKDSLKTEFSKLQAAYDLTSLLNSKKEAELLESRAQVKRSEDQLTKSKANEKVYLKRIKEQTLAMSEIQADSVIKSQLGPDSTSQKVVMKLAELESCDSIRLHQGDLITSLHEFVQISDSIQNIQSYLLNVSRNQVDILQSSSQIDKQLIQSKDKQLKKLKRRERVLKIIVPVAVVVTALLLI